ncbi:MAG: amidohydrolase family protein, partial [Armatimonadota bacterium]|nr:amidohydrolase family protein [Armatimonadota bacterium]
MIYRAAYVIPMDGRIIPDGELLVRGAQIQQVGSNLSASFPNEPVTDFGKSVLLPGFVNAHSHLDYTFTRRSLDGKSLWEWIESAAFNRARKPDMEIVRLSALLGAAELALSGVTCVADSSFTGVVAEALQAVGLRGIVYLELFGQSAGPDYARVFQEKLAAARELQSKYPRLAGVGLSPHSVYTSNRGVLELCAEACADGVPVAIHLAETAAEIDYLMNGAGPIADLRRRMGYEPMTAGMMPVEYLRNAGLLKEGVCLAHCVTLSPSEVELIARSGAGVAHCPQSNAFLGCGIAPAA